MTATAFGGWLMQGSMSQSSAVAIPQPSSNACRNLGVQFIVQACSDKIAAFEEITAELGVSDAETAYVGDDLPDLPLLSKVAVSFAVANAVSELHQKCDFVTKASGGFGAVREVCDAILDARQQDGK